MILFIAIGQGGGPLQVDFDTKVACEEFYEETLSRIDGFGRIVEGVCVERNWSEGER